MLSLRIKAYAHLVNINPVPIYFNHVAMQNCRYSGERMVPNMYFKEVQIGTALR